VLCCVSAGGGTFHEYIPKGLAVASIGSRRLKNEFLEEDGVRFVMADEVGNTVACGVTHEALRDYAERAHLSGSDSGFRNLSRINRRLGERGFRC
jgi:hypothetical protein